MRKLVLAGLMVVLFAFSGLCQTTVPVDALPAATPGSTPTNTDLMVFYHLNPTTGKYVAMQVRLGLAGPGITNVAAETLVNSAFITNTTIHGLNLMTPTGNGLVGETYDFANGWGLSTPNIGVPLGYIEFSSGAIETSHGVTLDDGGGNVSANSLNVAGAVNSGTENVAENVTANDGFYVGVLEVIDSDGEIIDNNQTAGTSGQILESSGGSGDFWQSLPTLLGEEYISPLGVSTGAVHTPGRVSLTGSPFTLSNPNQDTIVVVATDSNPFSVAVGGITIATATSFYYPLPANASLVITYTGSPSVYTNAW